MNTRILVMGLVAAFVFPLAAMAEEPAREEQIAKLFDELVAKANEKIDQKTFDIPEEAKVNALTYDEQSLTDLANVLKKVKSSDAATVYAGRVMLQPLLRAKPEVMLAGIKEVDRLRKKIAKYRDFHQLSDAALDKLKFPEYKPGVNDETWMKIIKKVQELRDAKLKKDLPVQMHNIELHNILRTQVQLIISAKDEKTDKELFELFSESDRKKLHDCVAVLGLIQQHAGGIAPERLKKIRDEMLELGNKLKTERREYVMPTVMTVSATANSTIAKRMDYPGLQLLNCVNNLNKILKEPEITVPSTTDVDKYIADRQKKGGR